MIATHLYIFFFNRLRKQIYAGGSSAAEMIERQVKEDDELLEIIKTFMTQIGN